MHLNDIINHLGEDRPRHHGAITPPTYQTSNFAFESVDDLRKAFLDEKNNHLYSRGNNPSVALLRQKIAALESTDDALVCSSGVAAIAMAIMGNVNQGDHIICVDVAYSWTKRLLTEYLPRFGVSTTFVDGRDMNAIEAARQNNTKLLWLESPGSLLFHVQDLAACATFAKKYGIITGIDNSYASPLFQQPAQFGIDIITHSATKYLNGHSDLMAGVICGTQEMIDRLFMQEQMCLGNLISAHKASMILRGLRTMEIRVQRSNTTALELAQRLEHHPKIRAVHHPGLQSFPQHHLAQNQMSGFGGLFSIELNTDSVDAAERFSNHLECFLMAISWGGYESLQLPIATFYNMPDRTNPDFPVGLVRIYVGLEDVEVLWKDLQAGLELV